MLNIIKIKKNNDCAAEQNFEKPHAYYLPETEAWFRAFAYGSIPIIGWIYLFRLSRSKTDRVRRCYAKAMLKYKGVMLLAAIILVIIAVMILLPTAQHLIDYMDAL